MLNKKKVHYIKLGLLAVVIVMSFAYITNKWLVNRRFDTSYPEIIFGQEVLEVSVKATEEELLKGVTAIDKKDGDVTDSIIIESISNMLEGNQRIVTYVAFDKDNHVGKAERKIVYTDYVPIRFSLEEPLVRVSSENTTWEDVLKPLKAIDCIDGDVSENIILLNAKSGGISLLNYVYNLQVTNSSGDIVELQVPVEICTENLRTASKKTELALSTYLTYVKVGQKVDLEKYIESVHIVGEEVSAGLVTIDSDLNTSQAGTYIVTYTAEKDEMRAESSLVIIVEE